MFSLSFLNSGILALSSAILIPILIYLFARKKPRKVEFSSIRFIKISQKKQRKKINLKNLLLLLIRMLIILFTVLAISRPSIKSPYLSKGSSHPKTAAAIIIDNSYSMDHLIDTRTELERAKDIAVQINALLSENDITAIFTCSGDWNEIYSGIRYGRIPEDLIRNISLTAKALPIKELLPQVEKRMRESHLPNQEIYFITDMQSQDLPEKIDIQTYFISTSEEAERMNISCENSAVYNEIVGQDNRKKLLFEAVNQSEFEQNDVILQLHLNGHTAAEKVTNLNPGQRRKESFEITLDQEGWYSGYVEIKNERLSFDNRNYFTFYFNPEPRIGVITDLTRLPIALETILEIYAGSSERVDLLNENDLTYEQLSVYDNLVFYRKNDINPRLGFLYDKLIQEDRDFLFITDPELSAGWQEKISESFVVSFRGFLQDGEKRQSSFINPYHPITELISNSSYLEFEDLWNVRSDSNILLQSQELPVAIEKDGSILWLFNLASLSNPFILNSAYPVFSYNCLQYLVNSEFSGSALQIGDKIRNFSGQIVLPSGDMILWNQPNYAADEIGIYVVNDQPMAVNLDYSESKYIRSQQADRKNLKFISEGWESKVLQSRYGFEIWKYLLLAVLFLFVCEMLLVKSEERK